MATAMRCGPDSGIEPLQRPGDRVGRYPERLTAYAVEFLPPLDDRRGAAMAHVLADGPHRLQGGFHVELGTGQQVAQGSALGEGGAAQVDSRDHMAILADRPGPHAARITG